MNANQSAPSDPLEDEFKTVYHDLDRVGRQALLEVAGHLRDLRNTLAIGAEYDFNQFAREVAKQYHLGEHRLRDSHGIIDAVDVNHRSGVSGHGLLLYVDLASGHVEANQSPLVLDDGSTDDARVVSGPDLFSDDAETDDELEPMSEADGEAFLKTYTESPPDHLTAGDNMLGAVALAKRLKTTRQTIRYRYDNKQIIGLTREVGSLVYPLNQFVETPAGLRWLDGLDRVIARHGNGWQAWLWLTHERRDLGNRCALDRLRAGDINLVREAMDRDDDGAFS